MKIGDRIRGLRIEQSLTQKELSAAVGVTVQSLQCWESGTKSPSASALVALANILHVTTDELLGVSQTGMTNTLLMTSAEKNLLEDYRILDKHGKNAVRAICSVEKSRVLDEAKEKNGLKKIRYIPKFATPSAAGYSVPIDEDDFEMIPMDDSVPANADFAVVIQGDSMKPYIKDGDTVYVSRSAKLSIGDVGIFSVDGAMVCKQYYVDEEKNLTLVSANRKLKNTNVYVGADSGTDVRCYGKVLLGHRIELPDYFVETLKSDI